MDAGMKELNKELRASGMPELDVVSPKECKHQRINARYMNVETMSNLVANLKRDKRLESVPLVYKNKKGEYEIISGHHRIRAAIDAGIEKIVVMITKAKSKSEVVAKQLSHNALNGLDDEQILEQMYSGLDSLQAKYYSGLQDQLEAIGFISLSYKAGEFQEFTIAFMPEGVVEFDRVVKIVNELGIGRGTAVRLDVMANHAPFLKAIIDIKKAENIKSNDEALSRMIALALERIEELSNVERTTDEADGQEAETVV